MMQSTPSPTRRPPSPPDITSKAKDLLSVESADVNPVSFPKENHLVVTTSKGVYYWTLDRIEEVFHSGSEGIVAAKKSKDGSGIIAIADSHVVVLHDTERVLERSYRLKGTDGQVRLLRYANDSKSLYFTTTLQNSVQSYCIAQSKLLDPSHDHPSPPTTLAISPNSHYLLSASANPPTIHLQNLILRTRPVLLRPSISSAAVVVASFHPNRPNVFLLGFADGTLACYDATRLLRDSGRIDRRVRTTGAGQGGETSYIKRVHISSVTINTTDPEPEAPSSSRTTIISATAFIPGSKSRAISVGLDGRCCVLDFDSSEKRQGKLIKTWHVRAPATSLSILPSPSTGERGEGQGSGRRSRVSSAGSASVQNLSNTKGCMIAIGRIDGKVLIFNLEGYLLGEKTIDPKGGRIIDVDWMPGAGEVKHTNRKENHTVAHDSGQPTRKTRVSSANPVLSATQRPAIKSRKQSLTPAHASSRPSGKKPSPPSSRTKSAGPSAPTTSSDALSHRSKLRQDLFPPQAPTYMGLFSPIKTHTRPLIQPALPSTMPSSPPRAASPTDQEPGESSVQTGASETKKRSPPPIPPRPTPRKYRRASVRKGSGSIAAEGILDTQSSEPILGYSKQDERAKVLAELRNLSQNAGNHSKGLRLFAPYIPKNEQAIGLEKKETGSPNEDPTNTKRMKEETAADIWLTTTDSVAPPPRWSSRKNSKGGRLTAANAASAASAGDARAEGERKVKKNVSFEEVRGERKERGDEFAIYEDGDIAIDGRDKGLVVGGPEIDKRDGRKTALVLGEGSGNGNAITRLADGDDGTIQGGKKTCMSCGHGASKTVSGRQDDGGNEWLREEMTKLSLEVRLLREEFRKGLEVLKRR